MERKFTIRLHEELLSVIEREALEHKVSASEVIRRGLTEYFKGSSPKLDSLRLTVDRLSERLVERMRLAESHASDSDELTLQILQNLNSTVSDMREILQEMNVLIPKTFFRNTEKVMLQLLTNSFYQAAVLAPVAGEDVKKLQGQAIAARNEFLEKMKSE